MYSSRGSVNSTCLEKDKTNSYVCIDNNEMNSIVSSTSMSTRKVSTTSAVVMLQNDPTNLFNNCNETKWKTEPYCEVPNYT